MKEQIKKNHEQNLQTYTSLPNNNAAMLFYEKIIEAHTWAQMSLLIAEQQKEKKDE